MVKGIESTNAQHCIRAIAGEVVKSMPDHVKNFCGGGQVIVLKTATALILDRSGHCNGRHSRHKNQWTIF